MILKVLSMNIHKGFQLGGVKFVLHELKEILHKMDVDLVLLQEVVGEDKTKKSVKNWPLQAQFEFIADQKWPHFSYGKNAVFSDRHHGNAVLSRFPIVKAERLDLSTNRFEQRGLLHCMIDIPELRPHPLHVLNVHLDLLERGRKKQFEMIHHYFNSILPPGEPLLFGGDFNDWTHGFHETVGEFLLLEESHTKMHGRTARSFPSFMPMLNLDRLYFKNLKVKKCQVLTEKPWSELSDHLALYAEFDISLMNEPIQED